MVCQNQPQFNLNLAGKDALAILSILALGCFICFVFLKTYTDFWFDDDATLFAFVSAIENPYDFFFSQKVISSSGFSFTPLQMISYWCDLRFGGLNPGFAYSHSTLSYLLSGIMLFLVLRFLGSTWFSLLVTICWMLLPSTISVYEFIGTRHYMEGFLLLLCSLYFSFKCLSVVSTQKRYLYTVLWVICLFAAMLCKEIYVTAGPFILFFLFLSHKRYVEAGSVVGVSLLYAIYRLWAMGLSSSYPSPKFHLSNYLDFLIKLPYIFSGNYVGYILLVCVLIGVIYWLIKRNHLIWLALLFVGLLIVNLITIYPGSYYLANEWDSKTTWYRIVFFLNFQLLLGGVLLFRSSNRLFTHIAVSLLVVSVVSGSYSTRNKWNALKDRYNVTGRYYIENSDKIIYSEVPAYWYLGGLKRLYDLKHPYITSFSPNNFNYHNFDQSNEVWRYQNGKMVADHETWKELTEKYSTIKP